ncbi:hypothetical protein SOVF_125130 [Spinacia oleracea]|nr:hypothetical protein SOVF_125130 [Spinacia oleracea]
MQQTWKKPAEIKKKPTERKPTSSSVAGSKSKPKKRNLSKVKDPNMLKRPMSCYFLILCTRKSILIPRFAVA